MADEPILKLGFYFGSTLAGYSRVYDDAHYLSQVLLGYAIAYLAVESTDMTNESNTGYRVVPLTISGAYGFGIEAGFYFSLRRSRDNGLIWKTVEGAPGPSRLATATDGERVVLYVGSPGGLAAPISGTP